MKSIHTPALGVALACLVSVPGAAFAQSKVELFGVVDVGVAHLGGSGASKTGLSTGGANISRLGFRGTEDLGGGLKAGFWLEAGLDVDSGAGKAAGGGLNFNRRSTVSLMGNWGEVRLGRDDSATFLNTLIFDPFLTNGVGGTGAFTMLGIPGVPSTGGAPIQISNAVSYFLPQNLGGFYGQAQLAFGEQPSGAPNKREGDYRGLRLGYRQGAFNGALATGRLYGNTSDTNLTANNVGLSYDFGVAKPMLLWASEKRGGTKITAVQLGVTAPLGNGEARASFGHYNLSGSNADWNKISVGYGYNLSKRTQVYGTYAFLKNKGSAAKSIGVQGLSAPGTTPGGNSNGLELGIRHFF
ncbi:porin [Comamonas thiooxydans]|uniref:Porin n=1 Tax=Comamonas thiooxydans TaxID=363952 RepID=A0AA42TMN2_9BURK|nr:porin [Comamonas thiooxydans]MDH1332972.1 porin [Comamonas thiooxydans]MDH1741328.1 porin [Comamonas thiooxydans]MDH1785399.1 porin [Comamonas thiooxydans]